MCPKAPGPGVLAAADRGERREGIVRPVRGVRGDRRALAAARRGAGQDAEHPAHRRGEGRRGELSEATVRALDAITPENALGWFGHCGYPSLVDRHQNRCIRRSSDTVLPGAISGRFVQISFRDEGYSTTLPEAVSAPSSGGFVGRSRSASSDGLAWVCCGFEQPYLVELYVDPVLLDLKVVASLQVDSESPLGGKVATQPGGHVGANRPLALDGIASAEATLPVFVSGTSVRTQNELCAWCFRWLSHDATTSSRLLRSLQLGLEHLSYKCA